MFHVARKYVLALALILLTAGPGWAHGVSIFAYVNDRTIHTESYFSNGQPVREGRVQVFDSARNQLLEGRTDDEGLFEFPIPKVDDLTLAIEAGMGHKGSFVLKKSDLED